MIIGASKRGYRLPQRLLARKGIALIVVAGFIPLLVCHGLQIRGGAITFP